MRIKIRRMTDAARQALTGANAPQSGEPIWATDTKKLYVGDGATDGGVIVGAPILLSGSIASGSYAIMHLDGRIEQHIRASSFGMGAGGGTGNQAVGFLVPFTNAASINGFINSKGAAGRGDLDLINFTVNGATIAYNMSNGPFSVNIMVCGV